MSIQGIQNEKYTGTIEESKLGDSTQNMYELDLEDGVVENTDKTTQRSCVSKNLEFLTDVNFKFVRSVFSLKKVLCPFTFRKFVLWVVYAILFLFITGYGSQLLELLGVPQFPSAYKFAEKGWLADYTIILVIVTSIDPVYMLLSVFFGKSTDKDLNKNHDKLPKNKSQCENMALVIVCHNSSGFIEGTVRSALVHFKPENVYIADNGNSENPTDDTNEVIHKLDPNINYRWVNKGNKSLSQFLTVKKLMEIDDIKYVMVIDDDTKIPAELSTPIEKFDDITKGIMYGIRAVDDEGKQESIWTRWQDMEFKIGDFIKKFQTKYGSVLFPHGAVSLWEKEMIYDILAESDTIFYVEDGKMGMHLSRNGYKLHYCQDVIFETLTPSSLIGKSPNFYEQRVRSWDFGEHMAIFKHFKSFFLGYVRKSIFGTLMMKISQLYLLITIINDWIKVPIIIVYTSRRPWFFLAIVMANIILNLLVVCIWNYWSCRNRPDVRVGFMTIWTSPIYRLITTITRILSVFYCCFIYWTNYKAHEYNKPGTLPDEYIQKLDKFNDEPIPHVVSPMWVR